MWQFVSNIVLWLLVFKRAQTHNNKQSHILASWHHSDDSIGTLWQWYLLYLLLPTNCRPSLVPDDPSPRHPPRPGDTDTGLWMAESHQVISILASDRLGVITWPGYWPLIGQHLAPGDTCHPHWLYSPAKVSNQSQVPGRHHLHTFNLKISTAANLTPRGE